MSTLHIGSRWDDLKRRLQQSEMATEAVERHARQRQSEVYGQRASRFAARRTRDDSSRGTRPTLVFAIGSQRLGIPLIHIAQVCPACSLTPVPRAPSWILGVANFQSQIRSVIDLATLLELSPDRDLGEGNILLLRCAAGNAAVRVDHVDEVQSIDLEQLACCDQQTSVTRGELIRGVTPEHLLMLSVDALLAFIASCPGDRS